MKPSLLFSAALSLSLLAGCSLLPKKVEYFQHKVKPLPEFSESAKEHLRQCAQVVAVKTAQTKEAAIAEGSSTNVLTPAADASTAAQALSQSLGPPHKSWSKPVTNLTRELQYDLADFNAEIEDYRNDIKADVGKKIEGTGRIQIGYFTQWVLIIGFVLLVWAGLKVYGLINPAVGLGVNLVGRVGSSILSRGVAEIVAGGERFKNYLKASGLSREVQDRVADLFRRAQMEAQSQDVQAIVTDLTRQTSPTVPDDPPSLTNKP